MPIKFSSKFHQAATVINEIPAEKFMLLLNRIMQKLHLKNERLFTETEEMQLIAVFDLTLEKLNLVLDGCCYVIEQAAFQGVGPEPLYEQLLEAGFDELHGKALGRIWATERAEFVSKLKQRTLGYSSLVGTDYHLNLIVSESNLSKLQEPTALFEFTLTTPAKEELTEKTSVEFAHNELYSFFLQLERVQQQLDALNT